MFSHLAQFLPEQWSLVGHLPSIPRCSKCNLPIDADLHMIKISPDQLFHTHCALCSVCSMSLFPSLRSGFASAKCFQRNGRLFCSTHYFEFFAPRCAGCQSPILPHEFAYKLKTELIFHMGCLRCAFCGELLGKGAQIVFDAQHRSVICAKHQRWSLTGQTEQKPVANAEANCGTNFSSCVPSNNVQKSSTEVGLEHDDDTALFIGQQHQMDCATMPTSFRLPMATSAEPEDLQLGCCARGQSGGELSQEGACTSAISPPNSPQLENCSPSVHPEKAAQFGCTASSAEGATRNKPKARTDSDQSAGSSTGGARVKRTTTPVPVLQYPFEMYAAGEQFARQEEDAQQSAMGAKRRGPRTTISQRQLDILNHIFAATPKPSKHARAKLALDAGLSMRVIQVWFQNRRSKERRLKHLCNFLRHCDTQSDSAEMKREAMEEDEDQQEQ